MTFRFQLMGYHFPTSFFRKPMYKVKYFIEPKEQYGKPRIILATGETEEQGGTDSPFFEKFFSFEHSIVKTNEFQLRFQLFIDGKLNDIFKECFISQAKSGSSYNFIEGNNNQSSLLIRYTKDPANYHYKYLSGKLDFNLPDDDDYIFKLSTNYQILFPGMLYEETVKMPLFINTISRRNKFPKFNIFIDDFQDIANVFENLVIFEIYKNGNVLDDFTHHERLDHFLDFNFDTSFGRIYKIVLPFIEDSSQFKIQVNYDLMNIIHFHFIDINGKLDINSNISDNIKYFLKVIPDKTEEQVNSLITCEAGSCLNLQEFINEQQKRIIAMNLEKNIQASKREMISPGIFPKKERINFIIVFYTLQSDISKDDLLFLLEEQGNIMNLPLVLVFFWSDLKNDTNLATLVTQEKNSHFLAYSRIQNFMDSVYDLNMNIDDWIRTNGLIFSIRARLENKVQRKKLLHGMRGDDGMWHNLQHIMEILRIDHLDFLPFFELSSESRYNDFLATILVVSYLFSKEINGNQLKDDFINDYFGILINESYAVSEYERNQNRKNQKNFKDSLLDTLKNVISILSLSTLEDEYNIAT